MLPLKGNLKTYWVDPKHKAIIKEVMTYTYDMITKEIRNQKTVIKKTLAEINIKIKSSVKAISLASFSGVFSIPLS